MAANADDLFVAAEEATAPRSPGGTTVENGIETVTTTASRLFDWKKAALIAAVVLAIYLTWRETRDE